MRTVGLLVESGFQMMSIAPISAFEFANYELRCEAYRLSIVSELGGTVHSALGIPVQTSPLGEFPDTLMVVGALQPRSVSPNLLSYIEQAGLRCRRVAGVCTGAFALAEAGLLNGRSATTHWAHARQLQEQFPRISVDDDRIYIADGSVWTSAGMTSAIDLTLALIEDDYGAELSRSIARRLVVYHRRPGGQSQFSALLELEPRSDRVRRALIFAKENLRNPLTVEELAEAVSLSPRQFSRLFREETGQSPAKAVERLRLEAAKAMLEGARHPMATIAREAGFANLNRMRRAFLRAYRQPPQSLRRSIQRLEGEEL